MLFGMKVLVILAHREFDLHRRPSQGAAVSTKLSAQASDAKALTEIAVDEEMMADVLKVRCAAFRTCAQQSWSYPDTTAAIIVSVTP